MQNYMPIPSMYGIFTYIWLMFIVNVGKYAIHGWYGMYHHLSKSVNGKVRVSLLRAKRSCFYFHCDRLVFPRTTSWSKDAGGWLNFKLGRAEHLATKNSDAQAGFASRFKRCQQVEGGRSTLRVINLTNGHVATGFFSIVFVFLLG